VKPLIRNRGRAVLLLLALSALVALGSCANRQDVLRTKLQGKGVAHTYEVTFDQAWSIASTIFRLEPTEPIEDHRSEGYMLTSQNPGPMSSGAYLGVFFEPAGEKGTRVTFVVRRQSATQAYPFLNEAAFHHKFEELVHLMAEVGATQGGDKPGAKTLDAGAGTEAGGPRGAGAEAGSQDTAHD
jgi:hypothetical protein